MTIERTRRHAVAQRADDIAARRLSPAAVAALQAIDDERVVAFDFGDEPSYVELSAAGTGNGEPLHRTVIVELIAAGLAERSMRRIARQFVLELTPAGKLALTKRRPGS